MGVKGAIYIWVGASAELLDGELVPSHKLYQGVPTVFVQGMGGGLESLVDAAADGKQASVRLEANIVPKTRARALYTVVPSTDLKDERSSSTPTQTART